MCTQTHVGVVARPPSILRAGWDSAQEVLQQVARLLKALSAQRQGRTHRKLLIMAAVRMGVIAACSRLDAARTAMHPTRQATMSLSCSRQTGP